ncbi:MAG TPA: SUF system NifU family Fe-S cluster assembly protein, partial [Calditrichaeota bacterium]|nr:SUF system NifU family Fe-S cluster assembly protein [Calditrichota bacterium]
MDSEFRELYQEIIMDHNRSPRNFRKMEDATCRLDGHNPLCGDQYTIYLRVKDDIIEDASFEGSGCAISKASASVMTDVLKGKKL